MLNYLWKVVTTFFNLVIIFLTKFKIDYSNIYLIFFSKFSSLFINTRFIYLNQVRVQAHPDAEPGRRVPGPLQDRQPGLQPEQGVQESPQAKPPDHIRLESSHALLPPLLLEQRGSGGFLAILSTRVQNPHDFLNIFLI